MKNFLTWNEAGVSCDNPSFAEGFSAGKQSSNQALDESYRFSVDALSKEGFMPPEALSALHGPLVSQRPIGEAASTKLPVTAVFDTRFVNDLEKDFFNKL